MSALFEEHELPSGLEIFRTETAPNLLSLDIPRLVNGAVEAPISGGLSIVGWAIADRGVESVLIHVDGKQVASACCGLRRPDVAAAHPSREGSLLSGYSVHLPPKALTVGRHQVSVCLRDVAGQMLSREFLIVVEEPSDVEPPSALRRKMSQAEVLFKTDILAALRCLPRFRILVNITADDQSVSEARRTLQSLRGQTYRQWSIELSIERNKGRRQGRTARWLKQLQKGFEDVATQIQIAPVGGFMEASSRKAREKDPSAREWIMCQAGGDELGSDALLELALASALDPDTELWYCDERRRDPVTGHPAAFFKPHWSPDLLLSTNYLGRSWCAERALMERALGGLSAVAEPTEYDIALRLTESARKVGHISKVLHQRFLGNEDKRSIQRRTRPEHSSRRLAGWSQMDLAERDALKGALERRGIDAEVLAGKLPHYYRVRRRSPSELVSIIVPTCGEQRLIERCLNSLREHTSYSRYEIICADNIPFREKELKRWLRSNSDVVIDIPSPFNWSRANNACVAKASGQFLLFLNDDIEVVDADWLDALVEHAQRPEVGVVGALLLYPNRTIQHAGVFLDYQGRGRHAFRHLDESDPGYFGLAHSQRNVISVTGACLMTKRQTFNELTGFDEAHAVINNDLDYCLRSWQKGYLNVYTPHARLIHHEQASRARIEEKYDPVSYRARWQRVINTGDPYFNPNLSPEHDHFVPEAEPLETIIAGHPLFDPDAVCRILVVKLDHIGDCINALPAVRRLRRHFPHASIFVLAQRATSAIWNSEPAVDDMIELNFFHARSSLGKIDLTETHRQRLQASLTERRFDLAIDLRMQPDSREVLQLTGARLLVGFDHQGRFPWLDVALEWDEDVPLRTKHGHVADSLVSLVETLAIHGERNRVPTLQPAKVPFRYPAGEQRRLFSRPVVCVHPASGSKMRQWPLAKFSQLIDQLLTLDCYHVALIGSEDERDLIQELLQAVAHRPKVFDLVGKFPLEALPDLLARAALFVGNNSGPQHLAAALGIPTVGIHSGVVDAREWGPLGPRAVAVRKSMACSPCFLEHPQDCHREMACLRELPVKHVYEACLLALRKGIGKAMPQC